MQRIPESNRAFFSTDDSQLPDGGEYSYTEKPNSRYLWNEYFLRDVSISPRWTVHTIHGFIDQNNISVFGRPVLITLIARRSNRYAGTRFLKRGATFRVS